MNIIKRSVGLFGYELINQKRQPSLMAHLRNLISQNKVGVVIDAGANRGQFGAKLRASGYRGEIHSFEPVSSTFEILKETSAKDPDWHVHKLALGDEDGEQTINISNLSPLSSFLEPSAYGEGQFADIAKVGSETVEVRALDTALLEVGLAIGNRKVFLKMDTQGYDLKVFEGAREVRQNIVCLLSELSFTPIYASMPHYLDVLRAYEEAGYSVTGFFPVTRNHDLSMIEMDCVLVKSADGV